MDADFAAFVEAVKQMRLCQKIVHTSACRVADLYNVTAAEEGVDRMLAELDQTGQQALGMEDET